jgi:hypothetical protein
MKEAANQSGPSSANNIAELHVAEFRRIFPLNDDT